MDVKTKKISEIEIELNITFDYSEVDSLADKKLQDLSKDADLKIEIESIKIRNLLSQKYPMNFMTFHNGGYTCERKVMNLSSNEKKYWSWINNLDFFI